MDRTDEILQSLKALRQAVMGLRTEIIRLQSHKTFGDDPLITLRELAQMLNITIRQVNRYRKNGWIVPLFIQRRIFFRTSDVRNLINNHLSKK